MKINITVLREWPGCDFESYTYLADVLREAGHEVLFRRNDGAWSPAVVERIDTPCDLHILWTEYMRLQRYPRNLVKWADRVVFHIFDDWQELNVDDGILNIQPIVRVDSVDKVIQAPFGIRPWYLQQIQGIEPATHKDIDVLWCGLQSWVSPTTGQSRTEFLDEFQRLLPDDIRFQRHDRRFTPAQYAGLIGRSRIVLSLHGIAEHCYRYWEGMHGGACVLGQRFIRERTWKDITEVMPDFLTPAQAVEECEHLLIGGAWKQIAERQRSWLNMNYNEIEYRNWARDTATKILA